MRAFETEKTDVAEVDRSIYDIKDAANAAFEVSSGLTPEIVEKISEEKHDPEWMRIFRLKSTAKPTTRCRCRTGAPPSPAWT